MRTYVQLGRYGDIMTILPLLWRDAQRGQRNRLMVAKEFASILDGVNYCDKAIFDGPYHEIGQACVEAEKLGGDVLCTQINGPTELVREFSYGPAGQECAVCTSYQKEMWKLAGALKEWDEQYPLMFDLRDPVRELKLEQAHFPKKRGHQKPVLLLALGGTTSPFPYADIIRYTVQRFGKYRVLELPQADRIYDVLAVMQKADLLIATDSAPLHLARAAYGLPVIALTNDQPRLWNGSSWRPQHIAYCRYSDFPARFSEIMEVIEQWSPAKTNGATVYKIWNAYEKQPHRRAFDWLPIEPGACGRDSKILLQDEKRVPYLKDCLRMGLQRAGVNDLVCLTRPGISIQIPDVELHKCGNGGYAYRSQGGKHYPVVDLFCAKKDWWKAHLAEIPDYLLGGDFMWSHGLWAIFHKHGARMLPHGSVTKDDTQAKV